MQRKWSDILWGNKARFIYLFIAATILLFTCLGVRDLWTQEHRWADIAYGMLYHHDYLHPRLTGKEYYDKPLLSYWLIIGFAKLLGGLTTWALRLPSALAGLLAVWSIYNLGKQLKDRQLGLLAGWMLITTFYFIFWARTSSADTLNLAGTLFAVSWYFTKKSDTTFWNYVVFFLILAITALCKGLIGPVVACLAILPDLLVQKNWKKHLRWRALWALIPAALVYIFPFWASGHFGDVGHYHENGLMLVYQENILRYFRPFDHKGPIYTYFLFLPIYLLPWTFFFIPALLALKSRWKKLSWHSKWMSWSVLLIFLFLTLSGSRRDYYVLPLVPFAILLTADWIVAGLATLKRTIWAGRTAIIFYVLFFIVVDLGGWVFYSGGSFNQIKQQLQEASPAKPLADYNFVILDAESKIRFYLNISPDVKNYPVMGDRDQQTVASLLKMWPFLTTADAKTDTIYVSRKEYEKPLQAILTRYTMVEAKPSYGERLFKSHPSRVIVFIPKN